MNVHTPVYIFSAKRNGAAFDNDARTAKLYRKLDARGIPYHKVLGCYAGQSERAVVVPARHHDDVVALAALFAQESVLYLDANRYAWLGYVGNADRGGAITEWEPLGQWRDVRRGEAPDAYTLDPATGACFTAS